jgi:Flp pilus assembly protein protease CpaA
MLIHSFSPVNISFSKKERRGFGIREFRVYSRHSVSVPTVPSVLLPKTAELAVLAAVALIPAYGAWKDFRSGKIPNALTFPLVFLSVLAMATMAETPDRSFFVSLAVSAGFGYAFYRFDRWGAGDGKYYIALGWILLTLERGFGLGTGILERFTYASFLVFSLSVIGNLAFKGIRKKETFGKAPDWWNFSHLNVAAFVYLGGQFVGPHLPRGSSYLAMTLFFLVTMAYAGKWLAKKSAYVLPVAAVAASAYYGNRYGFALSIGFTVFFRWIEAVASPVFEAIDTRTVRLGEIRQGDIVARTSFAEISKRTGVELRESPLQGDEVFDLIEAAKKRKATDLPIRVYESFKMGVALYAGFVFGIANLAWYVFRR